MLDNDGREVLHGDIYRNVEELRAGYDDIPEGERSTFEGYTIEMEELGLYRFGPDGVLTSVEHGPCLSWQNGDGPVHESNKCKCGLKWPHPTSDKGALL